MTTVYVVCETYRRARWLYEETLRVCEMNCMLNSIRTDRRVPLRIYFRAFILTFVSDNDFIQVTKADGCHIVDDDSVKHFTQSQYESLLDDIKSRRNIL